MDQRANFSAATKKLLAARAGYQCSVLNCGRLTVGPGPGAADVVYTGMAAHILAAAPDGPRGTGGLSATERSSAENGIWCCYAHGKAIDTDDGRLYSTEELRAWKRLHEARKAAEVHGMAVDRFGLVESISVNSGPGCLSGRTFELSMRNVISGPNGSGKTVLARLIDSVANPDQVAEMSRSRDVDIAVRWFDPATHEVATTGRSGDVRHVLDGQRVPYVARPYKTIMLQSRRVPTSLVALAQVFDLNATALKALLEELPAVSDIVKDVSVTESAVSFVMDVNGRTINSTSDVRKQPNHNWLLHLELAVTHAKHHAQVEPTFLLVDEFLDHCYPELQLFALERVGRAAEHAQVAIITHSPTLVGECQRGWKLTMLESQYGRHSFGRDQPIDFEVN
ncbi:hypothetical protein [Lentzea cavernae]|uniref:AAA domain-containing protein, AbiEii toxin, Type IV TA system n=1 Tax=Lentzea cavernae TaxID=2020703 RepID=A0ABQ3MG84_9PSEU|nr:hypothetical protein [Lentzea cavernae]GHH42213.1 hypothetical protein GCM10017774_38190 [Lentzea cavernae]